MCKEILYLKKMLVGQLRDLTRYPRILTNEMTTVMVNGNFS